MSDPIISIESVSMEYRLYQKPVDMLRETLFGDVRHDIFWALRGVSFEVQENQRLGIIGANGAGKSTLLQIIAGNLRPSSGTVRVRGKISSLLSLTPAWNGEVSGIENIRFNLLMQGLDEAAIPPLTDEILEFTELGAAIYQPVKTYSSGMSARLAFAIATAVQPEILIIDEVMGAGDGYFAGKAVRRMQEMCSRGRALLFVSHSTNALRMMCDTVLWLENGSIRMWGPADFVLRQYEDDTLRRDEESLRIETIRRRRLTEHTAAPEDLPDVSLCRFRLRSVAQSGAGATHYVRAIRLSSPGQAVTEVPLHPVDIRRPETLAALDLFSSEWGRAFDRRGIACRTMLSRSGARKGAQFLVRRPPAYEDRDWPVEITVEVASGQQSHGLCVEFLDVEATAWRTIPMAAETSAGSSGWGRLVCNAKIPPVTKVEHQLAIARSELVHLKPVEIIEVAVTCRGEPMLTLCEAQQFSIRVRLRHNVAVPGVSVNLNITRSDGAYVFYQPSGLDGRNIANFVGESEVSFDFDPNPFAAGDYEVNVFACDGWSWENIPPADIFDRSLGDCVFKVTMARPVSFGLVNLLMPVRLRFYPRGSNCNGPAGEEIAAKLTHDLVSPVR